MIKKTPDEIRNAVGFNSIEEAIIFEIINVTMGQNLTPSQIPSYAFPSRTQDLLYYLYLQTNPAATIEGLRYEVFQLDLDGTATNGQIGTFKTLTQIAADEVVTDVIYAVLGNGSTFTDDTGVAEFQIFNWNDQVNPINIGPISNFLINRLFTYSATQQEQFQTSPVDIVLKFDAGTITGQGTIVLGIQKLTFTN